MPKPFLSRLFRRRGLNYDLGICIPAYAGRDGGILFAPTTVMRDQVDAAASAGLGWLRTDVVVQQADYAGLGMYDWAPWDRLFTYARSKGMKILACMQGQATVDGASPSQPTTPGARQHVAEFAAAAATHFGLGTPYQIDALEVGNETNTTRFWAPPSMAEYGALCAAVYPAVKRVRPSLTVVSGGPGGVSGAAADIPADVWCQQFYDGGWNRYVDAVGLHPYSGFTTTPGLNLEAHVGPVRALMDANGDSGKQLWATETGAPTGGSYGVSQAEQATILANSWRYWKAHAKTRGPMFIYTLDDYAAPVASEDAENYFGLRMHSGAKKVAYATIRTLV